MKGLHYGTKLLIAATMPAANNFN